MCYHRGMKITFFDAKDYDIPAFERYGKEYGISFKFFETKLGEDTAELARGYDGVCVFVNDDVGAPVVEKLASYGVRTVALRCAGYNNVDLTSCFGKIHVVRVPAYSPHAVAEHAMALLLTSVRRIHRAYNRTKDFNFSLAGLTGFELHGRTVGVVGTGKIGRAFIEICRGFGMRVIAYDKFPSEIEGVTYVPLEELLRTSDVISLHCPLTEETYHLIGREAVEMLKKGVVILNTSRGALIDAEALVDGIKRRIVGAACLDVYEEESDLFFRDFSGHIVEDDVLARLISMPNVLVTGHQAFLTEEALANIAETTVKNLVSVRDGGLIENELCYRCGKVEDCKKNRSERCF